MKGEYSDISVVIPVYFSEKIIGELVKQLIIHITSITSDFEIILVNDASPDASWQKIKEEGIKDKRVKGLNLSRNFGQHYAITAGLQYSNGKWIIVMDCDLQDRPEEILNLYNKTKEGYEIVLAQRIIRNDSFLKRTLSKTFYSFFSYLTDTIQDPSVANFGIYHRCVIDAILSMRDQIRFFPTMVQWVGFNKFYMPVQHAKRYEGKTTYSYKKLLRLAITSILAFSDKPLRLTIKAGFIITLFSFMTSIIYLLLYFSGEIKVIGFTSIILSIWLLGGIIIFILGIVGLYLEKVFEKVKERPLFIIRDQMNI